MDLKEKLLSLFLVLEERKDDNIHVREIRSEAIKRFQEWGFPKKKLESWKYTTLNTLLNKDFSLSHDDIVALEYKNVKPYLSHDIDSYKIVFIDGIYSAHLSKTTHEGCDICVMSAALSKSKYSKKTYKYFNKGASEEEHFTCLNTALAREGAYIYIPSGKNPEIPIQTLYISTDKSTPMMTQPRNLIILDKGAHATVIECHQSISGEPVFSNAVTEVFLEQDAHLDYYKIQNDRLNTSLIDNTYIHQAAKSNATVHTFSFGGDLVRNNLNFYQKGERANSILKGVTILSDGQHVDHQTLVHHQYPNCESHQDYKGIYSGSSTGVFNGKVLVESQAQKINAFQQNNNILISPNATVNTKPQLEIFADDVKCSHGCTVGQLDDLALFYFQTRGICQKKAKALLMYAFASDVIESVTVSSLRNRLQGFIAEKLGVHLGFRL